MQIRSFAPEGYHGHVVAVEVDVRRGIPGTDIVGLASTSVREARERVRAAIRNAGLAYPRERVLINLGPADIPKNGNRFDLGLAAAVLEATGQGMHLSASTSGVTSEEIMALGELGLDGSVREARGVISAVVAGKKYGVRHYVVPAGNVREARAVGGVNVCGINHLCEWPLLVSQLFEADAGPAKDSDSQFNASSLTDGEEVQGVPSTVGRHDIEYPDFRDIRGNDRLKRVLEIAAVGGHHVLLAGPPGSGKTMAAHRLPGILPSLTREQAVEVTRLHSSAGELEAFSGLQWMRPFRAPHHSATLQGMVGGGAEISPGEISLAHHGVLFLDELPEFRPSVLQSLREPLESAKVRISRAGRLYQFPAAFQLVVAANLCSCGNLGRPGGRCMCTALEVQRYWRRVGRALLDRIDLRVPVGHGRSHVLLGAAAEPSASVRGRVVTATKFKRQRRVPNDRGNGAAHDLRSELTDGARDIIRAVSEKLGFSSRAIDSVLQVARTISDIEQQESLGRDAVLEAVQHRRLGEQESVWQDWQSALNNEALSVRG